MLISTLPPLTKKQVGVALTLLFTIIFARSFYTTNITSFYVFYLMDHYDVNLRLGQILIFLFMAFGVVGTFLEALCRTELEEKMSLFFPL